jgi:hypothetical protein
MSGFVTQTENFVTLVGEREAPIGQLGFLGMLTWRYPFNGEDIEKTRKQFSGVSLIPSSDGREIAAYFVAVFIEGSHSLTDAQFAQLRERQKKEVGTYPWADLKGGLSNENQKRIQRLIACSRKDSVFASLQA